jgi:hypothetical protein
LCLNRVSVQALLVRVYFEVLSGRVTPLPMESKKIVMISVIMFRKDWRNIGGLKLSEA